MRTDFIMIMVAVSLLLSLHCDGAIFSPDPANTTLRTSLTGSDSLDITNNITFCMWHSQAPINPLGEVFFSKTGTQFSIQDGARKLDLTYNGLGSPPAATEHWRSTANYATTNNIKFLALTFTFGTGSSIAFYSNMILVAGSWIGGDGNRLGSNYNSEAWIGGFGAGGGRYPGYYSEVYVWNSILTRQQLDLIYKSRVKGIGLQISPSTLKLYAPLDNSPNGVNVYTSSQQTNLFVDRSGNKCHFNWVDAGTTDPAGMAERICSYQPNE